MYKICQYVITLTLTSVPQAHGKPTYFITFTANPAWPEIQHLLRGRQQAADRPDAIMRVFKIKLQELLADLREGTSLGAASTLIFYVNKFQKRGLPHAHSEYCCT